MQDLVHETIPEATITKLRDALNLALTTFRPYNVGLSEEQRHDIYKMGEKSYAYVQKVSDYLTQFPDYTPRRVNTDTFASDMSIYQSLAPLRTLAATIQQMLDDTMMAAGSDMMEAASAYYHSVQGAAEDGDSVAKPVYEELHKRFPYRGVRETPVTGTSGTDATETSSQ